MKIPAYALCLLLTILSVSAAQARPLIAVTVPAQEWLVRQLAGEHVDVLTMVTEGHVPASTQPGPAKLARYQQADIHITVGHPDFLFESRYINPYRKKTIDANWLSMYEIVGQKMPHHQLDGTDPHLWTSPSVMQMTATVLVQTLARLEPDKEEYFRSNLQQLNKMLSAFEADVRTLLEKRDAEKLFVYHPAWGHFCQDFDLQQLAIEKHGKAPGAASLSNLFSQLEKNKIGFIISSPGADQRISRMIADQFRINMILINPMDADWFNMMLLMKQALMSDLKDGR